MEVLSHLGREVFARILQSLTGEATQFAPDLVGLELTLANLS